MLNFDLHLACVQSHLQFKYTFSTHDFLQVGVDKEGQIQYMKNVVYSDSGISYNENVAVHLSEFIKNGYDFKRWYIESNSVKTDTPSTTYTRAPSMYYPVKFNLVLFVIF